MKGSYTLGGVYNPPSRKSISLFNWLSKVTGVSACWVEGTDEDNHPIWGIIKRISGNRFLVRSRYLLAASFLGALLTMSAPGLKAQGVDSVNVSDFRGVNGFSINGIGSSDYIGRDGLGFGDINGDGYNDLIIGSVNSGETYVVFGGSDGFDSSLDLSSLDGDNGFILEGNSSNRFGASAASADINGDGIDDLLIGTPRGSAGNDFKGEVYVVFGHTDGFSSSMDVSLLVDGTNGFVMVGEPGTQDYTGSALSSGDINGDGIDDVIIGAPKNNSNRQGMAYVVFGQTGAFADTLQLENMNPGTLGFKIVGNPISSGYGYFGNSLGAGDINGDGIEDVLAGGKYAENYNGSTAVVFGHTVTFADTVQISSLDGSDGFQVGGTISYNYLGASISSGDINGDGYDDLIVGATGYGRDYTYTGEVMVIFGGSSFPSIIDDTSLDGTNGFFLQGLATYDYTGYSVSSADLNGDGLDELMTGSPSVNNSSGAVYVVFGFDDSSVSEFELSSLNGDNGFVLAPENNGEELGRTLIAADIDGDSMGEVIFGAPFTGGNDQGTIYVFFNTMNQTIPGDEDYRVMASPTSGAVFDELLGNFWTQGFIGSDDPDGDDTAWTWDKDTQAWVSLSNQSTDNLDAGQGFLLYMFSDDDPGSVGDAGFPKRISVSQFGGDGALNSGTINPISDLDHGDFFLAGNPFTSTIDWDSSAVSKANLSNIIYIYDAAASAWLTWNGTTGDANEGEIAPFQGFFIQGSGGSGSLSIGEGAISDSAGVFLKEIPADPKILKIHAEAGKFTANAWLSFQQGGELGRDDFDALSLKPLSSSYLRLATIIDNQDKLKINALPVDQDEELRIPLELSGVLDTDFATLSFEGLEDFEGWSITIKDLETHKVYPIKEGEELELEIQRVNEKTKDTSPIVPNPVAAKSKTDGHRFQLILIPNTQVSSESKDELPAALELQQNYPNPFNPVTTITYALPLQSSVRLEVFDLMGRKVATLVDGNIQIAGEYTVRFDASRLASGMYIYRLQIGETRLTRKLTLIK